MAAAVRAPSGRKIWKAVRDELMLNLYPLPFSTIAPTVYHVYLHPDDFDAIDGVAARVVGQIQQALTAEVEKVNEGLRRSTRRVLSRLLDREELPPIEEQPQQIEGLRGDVHTATALEQLARLGIENEGAERHSHDRCVEGRSLGNPWNSLETLS